MLGLVVPVKLAVGVLLSLVSPGLVPAAAKSTPPLFDPSLYAWKESGLTLSPQNTSLIIWFKGDKVQVLDWPSSVLNLAKGVPFYGYLYVRTKTLIDKAVEVFPGEEQGRILLRSDQYDYCVSIHQEDDRLRQFPGYDGRRISAACVTCYSSLCLGNHLPCRCGWEVHNKGPDGTYHPHPLRFIGVAWWDPKSA